MNFNSLKFLIFFPIVLLLYWLTPHRARWAILLAASYYFYMSWNALLIFAILGTTAVSYGAGLLISGTKKSGIKKLLLFLTLAICLGTLVFFKYFSFLLDSVIAFLNLFSLNISTPSLDIILPVGISFYTFQTLSYVIDVYRGTVAAEKHFGYYALFVSYFPQLVAGPIERTGDLLPQLKVEHKFSAEDMSAGLRIMLVGFFRKCVVADFCGLYVNNVFNNMQSATFPAVLIAGGLFCIQMYCDFAGYSEIAMGCARMMGVRLTKNFNRPYLSQSYSEFFRRWHITLNRWFTDYLYIPLGGNKKGKARKILNTVIVFALCGLWHGANWTYLAWGLYAAFFVCLESVIKKPVAAAAKRRGIDMSNSAIKLLRRSVMFLIFIPAAIIFRADSLAQAGEAFSKIGAWNLIQTFAVLQLGFFGVMQITLSIAAMCLIYNFGEFNGRLSENKTFSALSAGEGEYVRRLSVYIYAVAAIALCWLALLSSGDVSSFQYFQF